jgi:tripartite-type tricarboxylate transporter receptor subunit TctC
MISWHQAMAGCLAAAAAFSGSTAFAQAYPARPPTILVNFAAGGSTDVAARIVATRLSTELGQTLVVENRPGAGGTLGPTALAKAAPDGYTLGLANQGSLAVAPWMFKVSYDIPDFAFIGVFCKYRYVMIASNESPFHSVKEVVDAARSGEKPLLFGTPGPSANFIFPQLTKATGARFEQVLYKSGTEAATAVAANNVPIAVVVSSEALPYLQGGKVRLLASATESRWPAYPDVKTIRELGYAASIESRMALAAPKGTPPEIVDKLRKALKVAANDAGVREKLDGIGLEPSYMAPDDYEQYVRQDKVKSQAMVKELAP